MQAVAPVAEILHESERKSIINYRNITLRSIRQSYGIPVKISQSLFPINFSLRESRPVKYHRQSQISIRNQHFSFQGADSTAGCDYMQRLLKHSQF